MSIKKMDAVVLGVDASGRLRVADEHGAVFELEPEPEDQPRALCWSKGDRVNFKKFAIGDYSWKGARQTDGGFSIDSCFFKMITE